MIQPHSSSKYAVMHMPALKGYVVAAVHGLSEDGTFVLASVQFPIGDGHIYHAPTLFPAAHVQALAQTSEVAWKHMKQLSAQDREAVQR